MENLLKVSTKLLSQTAPGELIRLMAGRSFDWAIVLDDNGNRVLGFLNKIRGDDQNQQRKCFFARFPKNDPVVASLGADWVVLPIRSAETEVGNTINTDVHSGVFHIEGNRSLITLASIDQFEDPLSFETATWGSDNYVRASTISFTNWYIWASKEDAKQSPNNPLINIVG